MKARVKKAPSLRPAAPGQSSDPALAFNTKKITARTVSKSALLVPPTRRICCCLSGTLRTQTHVFRGEAVLDLNCAHSSECTGRVRRTLTRAPRWRGSSLTQWRPYPVCVAHLTGGRARFLPKNHNQFGDAPFSFAELPFAAHMSVSRRGRAS